MTALKNADSPWGQRRPLTVDEFSRMIEIGIFHPGERVELVEGALVSYAPPQNPPHAAPPEAEAKYPSTVIGPCASA